MAAGGTTSDAEIVLIGYQDRVRELFRVFAESVMTGEPERDGVVRFRRGLLAARRVRDVALEVVKESEGS